VNFSKYKKSFSKFRKRVKCYWQGGERILVLGDSHAGVFEYIFDNNLLPPHLINCDIVGGATAYGLNNDKSVTGALQKFQDALLRFPDFRIVCIMLGEVDCSFALWNRAMRENSPVCNQIHLVISGIERLLDWAEQQQPPRKFVLLGSILPTIKDHQIDQQSFELRRRIRATRYERTKLVLALNQALKELAHKRGLPYLDITDETIDPTSRTVRDEFLVDEGIDHHQSQPKTALLWACKLNKMLRK
jgi:hypothetical protein